MVAQAASRVLQTTANSSERRLADRDVVWLLVMVWLKFGVSGFAEYTAPHE